MVFEKERLEEGRCEEEDDVRVAQEEGLEEDQPADGTARGRWRRLSTVSA